MPRRQCFQRGRGEASPSAQHLANTPYPSVLAAPTNGGVRHPMREANYTSNISPWTIDHLFDTSTFFIYTRCTSSTYSHPRFLL